MGKTIVQTGQSPVPVNEDYPLHVINPDVLVVHCSSHKFQAAFRSFIREKLSPEENYDVIAIPGGIQVLTFGEVLPKLSNMLTRPLKYLVKSHHPRRIVLIAHDGCSWYHDYLPGIIDITEPLAEREVQDLFRAGHIIKEMFPVIMIEYYYAKITNTGGVKIEAVNLNRI